MPNVPKQWAVKDCEWLQHITKCYRCKHVTPCFSAWINERRRSMISLIFQKHPCATEMAVSNSPCILEEYVKVGDPKNLLSKSSLHILESAQQFNFRTLGGGHKSSKQPPKSRDKVAIKFGHPPLKIYWIRSDSEEITRNLKKCYANICTESIQAPPLILASNPFCAPFTSGTTVDAASNGTDEWWRKMRTFPSAFFL